MTTQHEITRLLADWSKGDRQALEKLTPLVYDELRRLAGRYLRQERHGHTLQSTALVHEAYLKLVGQNNVRWQNRAHFFGIAAQMIRRILVDYARARSADKRGVRRREALARRSHRAARRCPTSTWWRSTTPSKGSPRSIRGRAGWSSCGSSRG